MIGSAYPRSNIRVGGRNLPGTVVFENKAIGVLIVFRDRLLPFTDPPLAAEDGIR